MKHKPQTRKKKDPLIGCDIILNDIQNNPSCTHGPTVLFEEMYSNGRRFKYYSCSASRNSQEICSFYREEDQEISEEEKEFWNTSIQEAVPTVTRKCYAERLMLIKNLAEIQRWFCVDCSELSSGSKLAHPHCEIKTALSDEELNQPSMILKPRDNAKFHAQFMFASKSTETIIGMLEQLKATKVLCVGTPRIFEAIINSPEKNMSALLMDIDDRYKTFFSIKEFLHYNMFNHHFFDGKETKQQIYQQFITGDEKLVIVVDPPPGSMVKLLAHNVKSIQEEWRAANKLSEDKQLSALIMFPYFLESRLLEQLPNFAMLNLQVDYDNHPLYSSVNKNRICGPGESGIRVFVNDSPSLFSLAGLEGYRHCELCDRWVRSNNVHCEKCNGCMSEDGNAYKHCDDCNKCVQPLYNHCFKCGKCFQQSHNCSGVGTICFCCGGQGHILYDCPKKKTPNCKGVGTTCYGCGEPGHRVIQCPKKKRSLDILGTLRGNKKQRIENKNEKSVSSSVEVSSKKNKRKLTTNVSSHAEVSSPVEVSSKKGMKKQKGNVNNDKNVVLESKNTNSAVIGLGKKKKKDANSPKKKKQRIENKSEESVNNPVEVSSHTEVSSPVEVNSKKGMKKQKKGNVNSDKNVVLESKNTTSLVIGLGKKKKKNVNSPKKKKQMIENKSEESVNNPVEVSSPVEVSIKKGMKKQKGNVNNDKNVVLASKNTTSLVIGLGKKKMNANSPKKKKNSNGMTKKDNKESKKHVLKENLMKETENNNNQKNSNKVAKKGNKKTVIVKKKKKSILGKQNGEESVMNDTV